MSKTNVFFLLLLYQISSQGWRFERFTLWHFAHQQLHNDSCFCNCLTKAFLFFFNKKKFEQLNKKTFSNEKIYKIF